MIHIDFRPLIAAGVVDHLIRAMICRVRGHRWPNAVVDVANCERCNIVGVSSAWIRRTVDEIWLDACRKVFRRRPPVL